MISRALVILLAMLAAGMRASQHAWVEATGLAALALGLIILRVASTRRGLKPYAWACFAVTAAAMIVVLRRQYF